MNITLIVAALLCAGIASAQSAADDKILFGSLPTVEAVSLHAQTLSEAPANVTVITAAEIRRYGYRTLAEALASVPGLSVTYDHQYHYVGVSGISLPGDYNTRFLVMLNGHPLTDNIYGGNGFFGQDFGLDMDLVERIEIIRGPTSALYGSNGILANINVVTRSPVDVDRLRASSEIDSSGERKLSLSSGIYLGRGANLLLSGSIFHDSGSMANADGERGYHSFVQLIWHNWSFASYFNSRDKQVPVGAGRALSDEPGQRVIDKRNFVSANYRHSAGPGQLHWQIAFDQYRYQDRFDYAEDGGIESVRDFNRGDWIDSQLTYELPVPGMGPLTVGASGSWDLRAEQYNLEDGLRQNYTDDPERDLAVFAQQEWKISPRLQVYGGLRLDATRHFRRALSPRAALVYQASPRTIYKLVYGRPFRNPSAFEQFYNDGGLSYRAAPPLHSETAETFEGSLERRLASSWSVIATAYRYRINEVIAALTLEDGAMQYRNTGSDVSQGLELRASGKLWDRWEASGSSALGRAVGGPLSSPLANSPGLISKARLGLPLGNGEGKGRFFLAGSLQYVSSRTTWTGARLGGAMLADFTVTARINRRFDLQSGMHNAFNRRYEDPVYLAVDRMAADRRSVFLRLVCHAWE